MIAKNDPKHSQFCRGVRARARRGARLGAAPAAGPRERSCAWSSRRISPANPSGSVIAPDNDASGVRGASS